MKRVVNGKFKEFDIALEDRVGALADVCEMLATNGVNIKAISADGGRGVRLVTSDEKTTRNLLEKAKLLFNESDVISLELLDRPGELAKVSRLLAKEKVNIQSAYMLGGNGEMKDMILKVSDVSGALKALR
ncbi:MAG: hypothetical protein QXD77_02170 [Candidatus Aenigmatarchaeota archaeon]